MTAHEELKKETSTLVETNAEFSVEEKFEMVLERIECIKLKTNKKGIFVNTAIISIPNTPI